MLSVSIDYLPFFLAEIYMTCTSSWTSHTKYAIVGWGEVTLESTWHQQLRIEVQLLKKSKKKPFWPQHE